ncbi:TetR/AcrR family transcriptional regulator [Mycolicibacterium sp.]|uniref:TetR/AcrR family transcriptional regulator n=1 Tax=Mycolicibacterium sp. TaxID=2320850 RepID=UPI0037CB7328
MALGRPAHGHDRRRNELIDTAEQLFIEQGIRDTTVDDVLRTAGISKGAFYHYFSSKDDLIAASIERLVDGLTQAIQPVVDDPDLSGAEKFSAFFAVKSRYQAAHERYAQLLATLMQSDLSHYRFFVTASRRLAKPFGTILKQGADEGSFRITHPAETAEILISAVGALALNPEAASGTPEQTASYRDALHDMVAKTIGVDPSSFVL